MHILTSKKINMTNPSKYNPYHAPTADINDDEGEYEYDDTPFYKASGRIGRIRYLAYGILINLCLILITSLVGFVAGLLSHVSTDLATVILGVMIWLITMIGSMYGLFAPAIRRLNDLNKTGWVSLLFFAPIVNLLLWLYLVFARGDDEFNDYGAPAEPPTVVMYILAFLMPLFFLALLGVVAAIVLPAYQEYVLRSQMGL